MRGDETHGEYLRGFATGRYQGEQDRTSKRVLSNLRDNGLAVLDREARAFGLGYVRGYRDATRGDERL